MRIDRNARGAVVLAGAVMLLAAACGGPADTEVDAASAGFIEPEDAADDGADVEPDADGVGADEPVETDDPEVPDTDGEPDGDEVDDPDGTSDGGDAGADGACALGTTAGASTPSVDDYTNTMGEVNGEVESIVLDMDSALVDLEEGVSDGPSLADGLDVLLDRFDTVTSPTRDVAPPAGAEPWHDRVVASWVAVCEAILDGRAGAADGDEDSFARFVDALREFPSIYNDVHANAMVGPFEEG